MVQVIKLDIHASEQDLLTAALSKLQEQDARTAAEKVDRLMQHYRARGLAVAGPEETLAALAKGQVDELLISGGLDEDTTQPEAPDAARGMQDDGSPLSSQPDILVTKARQTGATVTFVEDPALLEPVGGVGAFLRWRE
jgi:peptide subunit release factor 1 (eRF1)